MTTTTKPANNSKSAPSRKASPTNLLSDGKTLAVQFAARIRLTPEQQNDLRAAFNERLHAAQPESQVPNRGISVITARTSGIESAIGMDRLAFSSLIGSRESIPIPLALRLQSALGVEVVSQELLEIAYRDYQAYLWDTYTK